MLARTATLLAALTTGCSREPALVYVLQAPQTLSLAASATPTSVSLNEAVTLSAQRQTVGSWKQIPRAQLAADQCWMARPPPDAEKEGADNLQWAVQPEGSARFNTDFRANHTRQVSFSQTGTFMLTPSSAVWCERRSVTAAAVRVVVTK